MTAKANTPNYIDKIVIKLRRQYGKDELVAHLIKQNSEKDQELGKLSAEIDHLNYLNQQQNNEIKVLQHHVNSNKQLSQKASIEVKKTELYQQQLQVNKQLRQRNKILTETNSNLIAKLNALEKNK